MRQPGRPILLGLLILGLLFTTGLTYRALRSPTAGLDAPLPAESAADMETLMPALDELRRARGSVISGTLLESEGDPAQAEEPEKDTAEYIRLLRREARRLDSLAADCEDSFNYSKADEIRARASQLRQTARNAPTPLGSFSINR